MAQTQVSGPSTVKSSTTGKTFSVPGGSFISSDYSVVGGGNTGTNAGANSSAAGGFNNPYPINPSAMFGGITGDLRAANEKRHRSLESQEVGEIQGERAFEQKSQDFARARLGKIGGFSGTYGIGLQNSIANRTESNIREIKRATQEAKDSGDFELEGRLAELGLQQMTLMTQLNNQAFQQFQFKIGNEREDARNLILDERADEEMALAQQQAERNGRDFQQLDNGDYGYFDRDTGKFIKQGNAAKPPSGSAGFTLDPGAVNTYRQDWQDSGLPFSDWAADVGLDIKTQNYLAGQFSGGDSGPGRLPDDAPDDAFGINDETGEYYTNSNFESERDKLSSEITRLKKRQREEGLSVISKEGAVLEEEIRRLEQEKSELELARFSEQKISRSF